MNVADALTRALDRDVAAYAPIVFTGVDSDDRAAIRAAFGPYVPEVVESTFNTWYIRRGKGRGLYIRRATWDDSQWREDVEGVCTLIRGYYAT